MTWLVISIVAFALSVILVRQELRGPRHRNAAWGSATQRELSPRFWLRSGQDMKKRRNADYCR